MEPRTKKRRAEGGIQIRSRRGEIGRTWWAKRLVSLAETLVAGPRLARGRAWARSGQVSHLAVKPGLVTAEIQGPGRTLHRVRIGIPAFSRRDWQRVEAAMAGQALFLARLLAGELPPEIDQALAPCRLVLLPEDAREFETGCTCRDWARACPHVAAACYVLAERMDEDPFLVFVWRGRTRQQILSRLRALRGAAPDDAEGDERAPVDPPPPISDSPEVLKNFWRAGPELSRLVFRPRATPTPDALLRELGPAPVEIAGKNLAELLGPAYEAMTRGAERLALGGMDDPPPG
ncbi:MAG: hypothetical protein HY720_04770 [Planctomycetes bacterium]|nr:hypothetical protein [Planctomycetota bacterium]